MDVNVFCIFTLVHINVEDEIIFGIGQYEKNSIFVRFIFFRTYVQDSTRYSSQFLPHQNHHSAQEKYYFPSIVKYADKIMQLVMSFFTERSYGIRVEGTTYLFEYDKSHGIFCSIIITPELHSIYMS